MALDQRGGLDREVAHEGRLVQLVLVEVLPQVFDELAVVLHVVAFHAELVGDLAQVLHGGAGVVRTAVRHDFLAQGLGRESYMLMVFHSPPKSYSVPSSSVTLWLPNTSMAVSCTSCLTSAPMVS